MKYTVKVGTENLTELMQEILAKASATEETVIEFEKGTYRFYRKGSRLHDIFSSGGASTRNYVVFPLVNAKNVTVNGNGSDFVFCDRVQSFLVQNCENVIFQNFQTDFSFLRYAWGTVTRTDETGFAVALDKATFRYFIENGTLNFVCGEDTLSTKTRKISLKRISPTPSGVYFLYSTKTEAAIDKAAPCVFVDAEECEDGVLFRYGAHSASVAFAVGDVVCLAYDNDREAQTFYCENSRNITVQNVSVYRGGGMGFVADICENITIDRLRIGIKEGRNEYFSTTADGVFLTNCSGDFIFKNSCVQDTYDDAMNIHGYYTAVSKVVSPTEVILTHLHFSHNGLVPYKVGDVLRVSNPEDFTEIGTVTVKAVSANEDRSVICLVYNGTVPLFEGALLENAERMPTVRIENSAFIHCPHVRLSAGRAYVYNNKFALIANDLCIRDLIRFWGESGAVERMCIIGNRFGNTAQNSIRIASYRPEDSNRLHKTIIIEGNEFAQSQEQAIVASGVTDLQVRNNTFGKA